MYEPMNLYFLFCAAFIKNIIFFTITKNGVSGLTYTVVVNDLFCIKIKLLTIITEKKKIFI